MYSESQANALKTHKSGQEEVEVTIRNLPNEAKTDDILEYLSIAGPIKTYKFLKEEERCKHPPNQTAQSSSITTPSPLSLAKSIWEIGTTRAEC